MSSSLLYHAQMRGIPSKCLSEWKLCGVLTHQQKFQEPSSHRTSLVWDMDSILTSILKHSLKTVQGRHIVNAEEIRPAWQGWIARRAMAQASASTSDALPPFHLAFPVNDIPAAKDFYGGFAP
jgi:hypothetical protein